MEFEPRSVQGRASIVRERTAHGRTVAPYDFGFRVAPSFEAPCDGAHPADPLFPCFLGMAVGVIERLRRLAELREVAQLVWRIRAHLRNGTADGQLAVRNDADKRPLHGLLPRSQQDGQVRLGR